MAVISRRKAYFVLVIVAVVLIAGYFFTTSKGTQEFLAVDACLDAGGAWNYTKEVCETEGSGPASDRIIRADGEDFDGLAVFTTWSTLEPATFPILIDGQARGTWFFEANFPIEIRLADGVVLARGYAQAQEDWMTTEVVPFYAELKPVPDMPEYVGPAALVLEKANPSDNRELDARFTTQIFIDTTQ